MSSIYKEIHPVEKSTVYFVKTQMQAFLVICLIFTFLQVKSQEDTWKWWNDIHHWEPGKPGWRHMIILSPGFLGPNALPVPEMKKGIIPEKTEIETTFSSHFHPGDPTQDISFRLFYPALNGKIAVEAYGVVLEKYGYTEEIRDRRISRDKDGKGLVPGDFYFSTLVQLCKKRKFPDTVFRFACKTSSGNSFAARYTDTPGYFFDFSSSKEIEIVKKRVLRPFWSVGFYGWQTYSEAIPQNDALLYGAGMDYLHAAWQFSASFSGYCGYIKNGDCPRVITLETRHDWPSAAAGIRFLHGSKDWDYRTIRISYIRKFGLKE